MWENEREFTVSGGGGRKDEQIDVWGRKYLALYVAPPLLGLQQLRSRSHKRQPCEALKETSHRLPGINTAAAW